MLRTHSTTLRAIALLSTLGAFALAWGCFIARFGWPGAVLGAWPAALIGVGGVLAVLQTAEMAREQLAPVRVRLRR